MQFIKLFIVMILSFFITSNSTEANITTTHNLTQLKHIINEHSGRNTLVIFDVDNVLIMPTDEYTLSRHPYRKKLWKEIKARHSKEEMRIIYGITSSKAKWQLVDPEITHIFKDLQKRKIPSIALSSIFTGKFGVIDKLEDWRIKQLQKLGFDFTTLSPINKDLYIKELEEQDGTPMLKSGVILTAQIDKAKILEYILNHYKYYPKSIIFIDDQLSNLESLEKMCSKLNIKYYGIHYTAVSKMQKPVIDEQTEKLRFQILEQNHIWLSHNELKKTKEKNYLN